MRVRAVLVAGALAVGAAAQPGWVNTIEAQESSDWKTTRWSVVCPQFVAGMSDSLRYVRQAQFNSDRIKNSELCRNRPDHPVTLLLQESSVWLKALGFRPPKLGRSYDAAPLNEELQYDRSADLPDVFDLCDATYCAVVDALLGATGMYDPNQDMLVLSPISFNGPPLDVWRLYRSPNWGYTEVHELFHAIQPSYPGWDNFFFAIYDDGWITEGTAEAVARAGERRAMFTSTDPPFRRQFDSQLHIRPDTGSRGWEGDWDYGTWVFWDAVGVRLESIDRIQYLREVLSVLADPSANGLFDVEQAMKKVGPSLYVTYPQFVADALDDPCYFSDLARLDGKDCTLKGDNEYRFSMSFPDTIQRLDHRLKHMASAGYEVRFDVPVGMTAQFTARVPDFETHDHLHMIADGTYYNQGPTGAKEAAIQFGPGSHSVKVRLAAVPNDPLAPGELGLVTTADVDAPVEFMLTELRPCSGEELIKTVHLSNALNGAGAAPMLAALANSPGFMDLATYRRTIETDRNLRPNQSTFQIHGLVSDGGAGCTDPFGVGFLSDLASDPTAMPDPTAIDIGAIVRAAQSGKNPAAIMGAMMGADPSTQDAVFFTYSPHAMAWQVGMPAIDVGVSSTHFDHPIEHPGLGGWSANSTAAVVIRLPGIPPDSVKAGRTYDAETSSHGGAPLYTRWTGNKQVSTCPQRNGGTALTGSTESVEIERLKGTVSITSAGSGVVEGTFALSGQATHKASTFRARNDNLGRQCGHERTSRAETSGLIQISGTLSAPARVETMRPGRAVSATVKR